MINGGKNKYIIVWAQSWLAVLCDLAVRSPGVTISSRHPNAPENEFKSSRLRIAGPYPKLEQPETSHYSLRGSISL